MAKFLVGAHLSDAVRDLLAEPGVRCAVAFWGAGSEELITGAGARVICNLRMGGTNPWAFAQVQAERRKRDDLHAKVYIGARSAVVASANASVNGLGLEGGEQGHWIEAGMLTDDVGPLAAWFEALWAGSDEIQPADWRAARKAWAARTKPTLLSFEDFDPASAKLPFVAWMGDVDWETCTEAIEAQFGATNEALIWRVEAGLELEHPNDEEAMADRWVLCFHRGRKGPPPASTRPWWTRLGRNVLKGAFRYGGEERRRDVVMAAETMPPVPFDPTEKRFVAALREVLGRPKYADLVEEDYEAPWFSPRERLLAPFWRDVKVSYLSGYAHEHGARSSSL